MLELVGEFRLLISQLVNHSLWFVSEYLRGNIVIDTDNSLLLKNRVHQIKICGLLEIKSTLVLDVETFARGNEH